MLKKINFFKKNQLIISTFDYIEKHPERYYLYLLWFSEHKPKPQTNEERQVLKRISKIFLLLF